MAWGHKHNMLTSAVPTTTETEWEDELDDDVYITNIIISSTDTTDPFDITFTSGGQEIYEAQVLARSQVVIPVNTKLKNLGSVHTGPSARVRIAVFYR